jgi:hypothetical protein
MNTNGATIWFELAQEKSSRYEAEAQAARMSREARKGQASLLQRTIAGLGNAFTAAMR